MAIKDFVLASLREFPSLGEYGRLLYLILLSFLIFFIVWEIYVRLSLRDLFFLKSSLNLEQVSWGKYLIYWIKYLLLFSIFSFLGFLIFSISIFILAPNLRPYDVMLFSIILVSTVRLSAYFHPAMAEDLAKLLPLAVIISIIAKPEFLTTRINMETVKIFQQAAPSFLRYFVIIFIMELVLKAISIARNNSLIKNPPKK